MACVTGDETGLLKVWDVSKSYGSVLKSVLGSQSRAESIMGMCWCSRATERVLVSSVDGAVKLYDVIKGVKVTSHMLGYVAALPHAISYIDDSPVIVTKDGAVVTLNDDLSPRHSFSVSGPVHAAHLHRKFSLAAIGGKENNLCVYDLSNNSDPSCAVFRARNVQKHVLDIENDVYITGACITNPFVFCTATAYHQIYFYDRRAHDRPVQEYSIAREMDRRPTTMLQWNCNKFLIGEAGGDVHLYDTRRGFVSRAKLRGGSGSVRCMSKHPGGCPIIGVAGLDRKARLYHVPTGRLIQTIYAKQKVNCVLLDCNVPFKDDVEVLTASNRRSSHSHADGAMDSSVWDDMDAVVDDYDNEIASDQSAPGGRGKTDQVRKICRSE